MKIIWTFNFSVHKSIFLGIQPYIFAHIFSMLLSFTLQLQTWIIMAGNASLGTPGMFPFGTWGKKHHLSHLIAVWLWAKPLTPLSLRSLCKLGVKGFVLGSYCEFIAMPWGNMKSASHLLCHLFVGYWPLARFGFIDLVFFLLPGPLPPSFTFTWSFWRNTA